MIELEIDGQKLSVQEGTTIIEAADAQGIYIPRFCYHKKLTVAANCRMCLVEVEKMGKPVPACATPITPGMKVMTQSQKALQSQRAVMEFLLVNHPLDCPICDQGGECELQDLAMGFGSPTSNYRQTKRAVFSEDIGPLVETEMTRCIQCTRCVRFGTEIAGMRELGAVDRGEAMEISTYIPHILQSELSGNIIDVCPVGALTNKPARYTGRAWEYREHPTIGSHDCVGSNLFIHTRGQEFSPERVVMRAVPRENPAVNEVWLSDRDRFSCHGLYHESRVYAPRIKKDGAWQEVSWDEALQFMVTRTNSIKSQYGAEQIAALVSPNATLEEQYLLQKLVRQLGSNHIDHRVREHDFSDQDQAPLFPSLGISLNELAEQQSIFLIGAQVRYEQPLINHRINQAVDAGAQVFLLNAQDYVSTCAIAQKIIVHPDLMIEQLAMVAKALGELNGQAIHELSAVIPTDAARAIAQRLKQTEKNIILLGVGALQHANASTIRALSDKIATLVNGKVGYLTEGANGAGAWLAGAVPHRGPQGVALAKPGVNAKELLTTAARRAYFIFNLELELDSGYAQAALAALKQAELVACFAVFMNDAMSTYADIILPIAAFSENAGTYINVEGRFQTFGPGSVCLQQSKMGWEILQNLALQFDCNEFNYANPGAVVEEINRLAKASFETRANHLTLPVKSSLPLMRVAAWPMYRIDPLVRRSLPLQEMSRHLQPAFIGVNEKTAQALKLSANDWVLATQGSHTIRLPLIIAADLADNVVSLPAGLEETAGFGMTNQSIQLQREVV